MGRPAAPALGWSNLRGLRVGLWGLGVEGAANLRRLRALGEVAVLVDDRPAAPSFGGIRVLATATGGLEALGRCEVVVKSPGLSRYRPEAAQLASSGVALCGGLGLWMQEADRDRVACVTGTKGKSTTTAIAGHLLDRLGHRAFVGGNLGRPPWDPGAGGSWEWWIVETSSFQATDLASSPPVVGVTSLAPDHLDWHGTVEDYYRDKLSACSRPGARLTVADGASEELRARAGLLGPKVRWVDADDPELDGPWADALGLPGRHYRRDALIARAVLLALGVPGAVDGDALCEAAAGFSTLPSRFHWIGEVEGVAFVDDGLSTNVLPTLAALEAVGPRAAALLVGGQDRGIDYAPLARALADRMAGGAPTLVVALPETGPRVRAEIDALGDAGRTGEAFPILDAVDLADATRSAFEWARPLGGVVLLSPAAPSFGRFRDYRHRSAVFAEAVHDLAGAARL